MAPAQMLVLVGKALAISANELRGRNRHKSYAIRRCLAMLAIRENSLLSFPEMGKLFGHRDHSTIIANCESGRMYREQYPDLYTAAVLALRS